MTFDLNKLIQDIYSRVYSTVDYPRMLSIGRLLQTLPPGEVWELGVYNGGSARLTTQVVPERTKRFFDSFQGLSAPSEHDTHAAGSFRADEATVRAFVGGENTYWHVGWIPETFQGLENSVVAYAHIDLDLHDPIKSSLEFIYPRMVPGGVILFDDYGCPGCPGAKKAVDDFFADKPEKPYHSVSHQWRVDKQ